METGYYGCMEWYGMVSLVFLVLFAVEKLLFLSFLSFHRGLRVPILSEPPERDALPWKLIVAR
jgi:hypothetical protein